MKFKDTFETFWESTQNISREETDSQMSQENHENISKWNTKHIISQESNFQKDKTKMGVGGGTFNTRL